MGTPASPVVVTSSDLFREVNATFLSTYRDSIARNPLLPRVMRLGLPSQRRREHYGYFESTPLIDRVDRGESLTEDGARVISYSVENLTWGKAIGFHEEDAEDLMLSDIRTFVRGLARRVATLPEEILFQIMTGGSSPRLLQAVPNAPDGVSMFSATDGGGGNRYQISGGNIVTGSGVATAQDVRTDFWSAVTRARQFLDTEGEPLLDAGQLNEAIVIYNAANDEAFAEAFVQGRTVEYRAGTSTTDTSTAASVSNVILDAGMNVRLWSTARLSDNDWFVVFPGVEPQIAFEQVRRAPRLIDETRENSERARRQRILASLLDMRAGYGVNAAYAAVKINN